MGRCPARNVARVEVRAGSGARRWPAASAWSRGCRPRSRVHLDGDLDTMVGSELRVLHPVRRDDLVPLASAGCRGSRAARGRSPQFGAGGRRRITGTTAEVHDHRHFQRLSKQNRLALHVPMLLGGPPRWDGAGLPWQLRALIEKPASASFFLNVSRSSSSRACPACSADLRIVPVPSSTVRYAHPGQLRMTSSRPIPARSAVKMPIFIPVPRSRSSRLDAVVRCAKHP